MTDCQVSFSMHMFSIIIIIMIRYPSVRDGVEEDIILHQPVECSKPNIILDSPAMLVFVSLIVGTVD